MTAVEKQSGIQKAVVIGAGFGGLAAAVRLRALGYEVTVLEAREQPGGRAGVTRRDGFVFDAGPTVITAPYLFRELFAALGRNLDDYVQLLPVDPFYRIEFPDGGHFNYVGEEERMIAEIQKISPADVDGYRRFATHVERIFHKGYLELADAPFDRVTDMLRVIPSLIRLESFRSVYGLSRKYFRDDRLRQVFSFHPLLVGGNPFSVTSIYALIHWLERKWGVHFPKGGTTALVGALVRLLEEVGVEVRLNAPVVRIESQGGQVSGVRLESGALLRADVVVSNADPSFVYRNLVEAKDRRKHTDGRIDRVRQSMSLFVAYFGARRTYPDLAHHTILLGPRYRELLDDIFEKKILATDFSLYLHAPTRTDPSMAPAGHENFYVLSPVPNQKSGIDWSQEGPRYRDRIMESLERYVPDLRANVVSESFITPEYFADTLRSEAGAAFGPEPVLTQSAWFRYHNRSEDLAGLYFVGSGTHPGAGVPGVLSSAKVLERVIVAPKKPVPIPGFSLGSRTVSQPT
jgi:phytoene desaturase